MNPFVFDSVPQETSVAPAHEDAPIGDDCDDSDDAVYEEIEALLEERIAHHGLPRRGCIELSQALEDVMALLMSPMSEFSDPRAGVRPMGAMPGPR
jgi:hypothetical protein